MEKMELLRLFFRIEIYFIMLSALILFHKIKLKKLLFSIFILMLIDLNIKYIAINFMKEMQDYNFWGLNFILMRNFYLFGGMHADFSLNLFIMIMFFILVLVFILFRNFNKKQIRFYKIIDISLVFLLGGFGGNIVDLIINGFVIDYLVIGTFVWNIADLFCLCGLILFLFGIIFCFFKIIKCPKI